MTPALTLAH
jgi:hypothetical protein